MPSDVSLTTIEKKDEISNAIQNQRWKIMLLDAFVSPTFTCCVPYLGVAGPKSTWIFLRGGCASRVEGGRVRRRFYVVRLAIWTSRLVSLSSTLDRGWDHGIRICSSTRARVIENHHWRCPNLVENLIWQIGKSNKDCIVARGFIVKAESIYKRKEKLPKKKVLKLVHLC